MDKINIMVVDDHRLFRKAIIRLIKTFDGIGEVWEAENGKECLEKIEKLPVNVLLLDLEMPKMNGVEVAENLLPRFPELKIIVLTMHDSEKYIIHLLEMGAHSFLLKNTDPEELNLAINAVMEKDFYHNEQVSILLRKNLRDKLKKKRTTFKKTINLTDREREILELICREKSTKEISQKLSISEGTINVHKHNLQSKLGVKSVIGLIRFAYESGILK